MPNFSYRSARSPAVTLVVAFVVLLETTLVHLLLVHRHAWIAWTLTVASLLTVAWLARDYASMGGATVRTSDTELEVQIGRRIRLSVPMSQVASAAEITWREIPSRHVPGYLNATKPSQPNVLVSFDPPATVLIAGIKSRTVRKLGMHLDDAGGFVTATARARAT